MWVLEVGKLWTQLFVGQSLVLSTIVLNNTHHFPDKWAGHNLSYISKQTSIKATNSDATTKM